MTQVQLHNSCDTFFVGMAHISSAAFVFNEDLACKLEITDSLDTEGILLSERIIGIAYIDLLLRVANV